MLRLYLNTFNMIMVKGINFINFHGDVRYEPEGKELQKINDEDVLKVFFVCSRTIKFINIHNPPKHKQP